ncbi:Smt3-specific protease [Xylographa bjoerkii]|nr:Smt3-specific protease [Xylographa bjoerkii]
MEQNSDPMDWETVRARHFSSPPEIFPAHPAPPPAPPSGPRVIGEVFKKPTFKHYAPIPQHAPGYQNPRTTISASATTASSRGQRGFGSTRGKPVSGLSSETRGAYLARKYSSTTGEAAASSILSKVKYPRSSAVPHSVSSLESTASIFNRFPQGYQSSVNGQKKFVRNAPKREEFWNLPYSSTHGLGLHGTSTTPVRINSPRTSNACRTVGEKIFFETKASPLGKRSHETFARDDDIVTQGNQIRESLPGAFPADTPPSSSQQAAGQFFERTFMSTILPSPIQRGNETELPDLGTSYPPTRRASDSLFVHFLSPSTMRVPAERQGPINMTDRIHNIAAACLSTLGSIYTVAVQSASTARGVLRFGRKVARQNKLHVLSAGRATMDVTVHTYRAAVQGADSFKRRLIEFTLSAQQPSRPSPSGVSSARRPRTPSRRSQHSSRATAANAREDSVMSDSDDNGSSVGTSVDSEMEDALDDDDKTPLASPNYVHSHTPPGYRQPSPFLEHKERSRPKVDANKLDLLMKLADDPDVAMNLSGVVAPSSLAKYRAEIRKVQKRPSNKPSTLAQCIAQACLDDEGDHSEMYSSPAPVRMPFREISSNASTVTMSPAVPEGKAVHFFESPNTGAPVNDIRYIEEDSTANTTFDFSSDLSECSEDNSAQSNEDEVMFTGPVGIDEACSEGVSVQLDAHEVISTGPVGIDEDGSQAHGATWVAPSIQHSDDNAATIKSEDLNNDKEAEGAMPVKADSASTSPVSKVKDEVKDTASPLSIVTPMIATLERLDISYRRVDKRTRDAVEAKRRQEEAAAISAQIANEQKKAEERRLKAQAEAEAKQKREEAQRMKKDADEAWLTEMHRKLVPAGITLLQPLSAEWQHKVTLAMTNNLNHQVATISTGTSLTRRDFGTVLPQGPQDDRSAWLNDNIIEGYLQLIVDSALKHAKHRRGTTPRYHAFTPFFSKNLADKGYPGVARWAKKAKIAGRDLLKVEYVIVPINPGNHWTVMVISPLHKTIEYFDSLSSHEGASHYNIELGKEWLRGELGSEFAEGEWTTKVVAGPRQENQSDCGVFAVTTARMILFGWEPKGAYRAGQIADQRRKMLAELMKGSLEEEFAPVWAWDDE